jgi:hypothetical protein
MRVAALIFLSSLAAPCLAVVAHGQVSADAEEEFEYAFQMAEGTYLSAARVDNFPGDPMLRADAAVIGPWETFLLIPRGGTEYAIQSVPNGEYVTLIGTVSRDSSLLAKFALACTDDGWCALRQSSGLYLSTRQGVVHVDTFEPRATELFRLLTLHPDGSWTDPLCHPDGSARAAVELLPVVYQQLVGATPGPLPECRSDVMAEPSDQIRGEEDDVRPGVLGL